MRLGIHGDGNRRLAQTLSEGSNAISGSPFEYGNRPGSDGMVRGGYASSGPIDSSRMMVRSDPNFSTGRAVYAESSVMQTGGMVKQGADTVFTPPSFYSPYHTASAWQIPTNRREVYRLCEYWITNEPRVGVGIDFFSQYPANGFDLICKNRAVRTYFEKLIKKMKLKAKLPEILREYYGKGDCFVMANLDCKHCRGTGYTDDKAICEHKGATWSSVSVLNPEEVEVQPWVHILGDDPPIYISPNNELQKIVQTGKPEEIFRRLPDETKAAVRRGQPIKLDPLCVQHFKHGAPSYQTYGVALIRRLFPTLFYRDKLRQAQWLIAERHIVPIKIVKVGTPERPASSEDLTKVQEQLSQVANDPMLTVVTHHAFDYEWVGASGKILQLTNEFEIIEGEMVDGMGITKAILSGEGPTYANAQVGIEVLIERLEQVRNMLSLWIEEKLFKPVAEFNGFTETDERGQEDVLIYPKIQWHELKLRDNTAKLQAYLQLRQLGDISARTMLKLLDIDFETEVEELRLEEMSQILASPELDLGGVNSGMGAGYGGGAPAMPGAEMGGGMPPPMAPPPGGGAPPGGDMGGGAPPPGPTAAILDHNYRHVISLMSDSQIKTIHAATIRNAKNPMSRIAQVYENAGVVNVVHDSPIVLGNGYRGVLSPEADMGALWDGVGPLWGLPGVPLQKLASMGRSARSILASIADQYMNDEDRRRRVSLAAGRDDVPRPKKFMSKIEGMLMNAILKQRYPYQFWGQYLINGDARYRIDFAFPQLKVAVEADGEEWHAGSEDIQHDKIRDSQLASQGWIVLRFTEQEIEDQIDDVVSVISRVLSQRVGAVGSRTVV